MTKGVTPTRLRDFISSTPTWIVLSFVHLTNAIILIYLILSGMKLYTLYRRATVEHTLDREYYSKNTDPDIQKWVQQNYPEQHHHVELEAAMGAKYLSEGDVIKLINKYCFE